MLCLTRLAVAAALVAGFSASHAQEATPASADSLGALLIERGLVPLGTAVQSVSQSASDYAVSVRDRASEAVVSAMNFLGVPYRRGGNTADDGFDCSGFTRHVYQLAFGMTLPRRADEQASMKTANRIDKTELQPGDLVFFNTLKRTFSHVGIYVGEGKFIHAPRTGSVVRVESMNNSYWAPRFDGARRVQVAAQAPADSPR